MTEGILLFQMLIISTILVTRVVSKEHVLAACWAWTLFTLVAVFASGLMVLQLVVVWGAYMLLRPKESVGSETPKEVAKQDGKSPPRAPTPVPRQMASVTEARAVETTATPQTSTFEFSLQSIDGAISRQSAIIEATGGLRLTFSVERQMLEMALERATRHLQHERHIQSLGKERGEAYRKIYEENRAKISAVIDSKLEPKRPLPAHPVPDFTLSPRYADDIHRDAIEQKVAQIKVERDQFRSGLLRELRANDRLRERFWEELSRLGQPHIQASLYDLWFGSSPKSPRLVPRLTWEQTFASVQSAKLGAAEIDGLFAAAYVKQILCLANSRKTGGRCIAGKEWDDGCAGAWLRPVSARSSHEVSDAERRYEGGGEPGVLDILQVPLLDACPDGWQQENWRLNPDECWKKTGRLEWPKLADFCDPVAPLWHNGDSTYYGKNDEIPLERAKLLRSSLRLIHAPAVRLRVFRPGEAFGNPKLRVQGLFEHAGDKYALRVTDPVYEHQFQAKREGYYDLGESYLTISIGEPYEKRQACYKLIAAIIPRDPGTAV